MGFQAENVKGSGRSEKWQQGELQEDWRQGELMLREDKSCWEHLVAARRKTKLIHNKNMVSVFQLYGRTTATRCENSNQITKSMNTWFPKIKSNRLNASNSIQINFDLMQSREVCWAESIRLSQKFSFLTSFGWFKSSNFCKIRTQVNTNANESFQFRVIEIQVWKLYSWENLIF